MSLSSLANLISFGLLGLTAGLMVLTYTLVLTPVGRTLPLTAEKAAMPLCAFMLSFIGHLFRIAIRGVGDFYEPWEPLLHLSVILMLVLVIFFTAYASARKQIKAAKATLESAA